MFRKLKNHKKEALLRVLALYFACPALHTLESLVNKNRCEQQVRALGTT